MIHSWFHRVVGRPAGKGVFTFRDGRRMPLKLVSVTIHLPDSLDDLVLSHDHYSSSIVTFILLSSIPLIMIWWLVFYFWLYRMVVLLNHFLLQRLVSFSFCFVGTNIVIYQHSCCVDRDAWQRQRARRCDGKLVTGNDFKRKCQFAEIGCPLLADHSEPVHTAMLLLCLNT